jgi:hypothetical protein
LDRIDYNIDAALHNTKVAKEELTKADKNMQSNCYRNAMIALIIVIFVMAVLLLLKLAN